mgnify:CR=1 FL=1
MKNSVSPPRQDNIPDILDVNNLIMLLTDMGVKVTKHSRNDYTFQAEDLNLDYLSSDEFVKKCYSPADQAIIVAGDVNADAVISTIRSMSYMTTAYPSLPESGYEWVSSDSVAFVNVPSSQPRLAGVTVKWRLPRAPREYMNTVQPAIYEKFVTRQGTKSGVNMVSFP